MTRPRYATDEAAHPAGKQKGPGADPGGSVSDLGHSVAHRHATGYLPPSALQSGVVRDGRPIARKASGVMPSVWVTLSTRATILFVSVPSAFAADFVDEDRARRLTVLVERDDAQRGLQLQLGQRGLELLLVVAEVAFDLVQGRDHGQRCHVVANAEQRRRGESLVGRERVLIGLDVALSTPARGYRWLTNPTSGCRSRASLALPLELSTVGSAMMVPPIRLALPPACWYWLRKLIASVPPTPR